MTLLSDTLKKVRDKLKEIKEKAVAVGDGNTPSPADQDYVETRINDIAGDINTVTDGSVAPSLTPANAGTTQSPSLPSSRVQLCQDAHSLGSAAWAETATIPIDYDLIGDNIKTINAVYIPEIETRFGL